MTEPHARDPDGNDGRAVAPDDARFYWLPDFCSVSTVGTLLVLAELVMLVALYAPDDGNWPGFDRVLAGSFLALWIALVAAVSLCQLRGLLLRLPVPLAVLMAYLVVIAAVALGSALLFWLDHALETRLTIAGQLLQHFVYANALVAALVAAVAFRYFYVQAHWRRQVRAQALSQLQALQARIRPHFLFNSMNTILTLIRSRPADAEHAVEDLSELFRAALATADAVSDLKTDLELVRRYLAIEKLRLGDRLKVEWQLAEIAENVPVPALLLQPLFENAIHHGIQPLGHGGTIAVSMEASWQEVRITIRNPRPLDPPRYTRGNRLALENTRQRLAYYYGERGRLEVEQGAGYYAVTVTLPRR